MIFRSPHSCFQALKKFQLDHEEILQRRRLFSQCLQQQVNEIVFLFAGIYTYCLFQWENLKKSDGSASRRSSSLEHRRSVSKAHTIIKSYTSCTCTLKSYTLTYIICTMYASFLSTSRDKLGESHKKVQ